MLNQVFRVSLNEASEVFDEQAVASQQMPHALSETPWLDMALDDDAVEAYEGTRDFVSELLHKECMASSRSVMTGTLTVRDGSLFRYCSPITETGPFGLRANLA